MTVLNQQLFSHTYLNRLLAQDDLDARAADLVGALQGWSADWDFTSPQKLMDTAAGPTFDAVLGFKRAVDPADRRVLLLTDADSSDGLLGVCFVASPHAQLDDTRKGSFWMLEAIQAARRHDVHWAMLTNGLQWRLINTEHLTPHEVFLQVDLTPLTQGQGLPPQIGRALAAFFEHTAWQRKDGQNAVDKHERASLQATQDAERHLKSRMEIVLRMLCDGFVESEGRPTYDEEERAAIFDNATVAVYRMLFALYAESRGLLPMDHAGYLPHSMRALAERALKYQQQGTPDDQAATLWSGLRRLWNWIDKGNPALKIPAYNGGLFNDTKSNGLDRDLHYLREHTIKDGYLKVALADLTYSGEGADRSGLDYRDLSVRHLGSLYEGMLECRLYIAQELMFERASGDKVQYLAANAGPKLKGDIEIGIGHAYFAHSPHERKASGSYYTPEYIVDYIVNHTVRAGLEERSADLRRAVQTLPSQATEGHTDADAAILNFIERQALTFRVCDPAMGSGHFLVNAAHAITNFIVETLNLGGWISPEIDCNPVLWRRRVVESCIYGVDLNPLAVELSKLSLWLITVVPDQPLSFLDHHLRCGNSLISARMADVLLEVKTRKAKGKKRTPQPEQPEAQAHQPVLLDDNTFRAGMQGAVEKALGIEHAPDKTVADIHRQAEDYQDLRERKLGKYRDLADVWVARHFGLEVGDLAWKALVQFTTGHQFEVPKFKELIGRAGRIARKYNFFHWELEFPQVLFADGESKAGNSAGFNAVIGNPPYVRQEQFSTLKPFLATAYPSSYHGGADLYVYFLSLGVSSIRADGMLGMITANKWLRADYAAPLRGHLLAAARPVQLLDFAHSNVFPGTDTFPVILVVTTADNQTYRAQELTFADVSDRARGNTPLQAFVNRNGHTVERSNLKASGWILEKSHTGGIVDKLATQFPRLRDQPQLKALFGIKTGFNTAFYIDGRTRDTLVSESPSFSQHIVKLLRGRCIKRWHPQWQGEWMIMIPSSGNYAWPWGDCETQEEAEGLFHATYPSIHAHLKQHERALRKRQDRGRFWWELRACDYYDALTKPKIVVQQILYHSVFAFDSVGQMVNQKVYSLTTDDLYLLGILNSRPVWWYVYRTWPHMKDEALSVQRLALLNLPVPDAPVDLHLEIYRQVERAHRIAQEGLQFEEMIEVERNLNRLVNEAFQLSQREVDVINESLPPRDPLVVAEKRLHEPTAQQQPDVLED